MLLSLRLPFLSFLRGWVDVKTTQAYKYGRHAVKKSAQVKLESFASRVFFLSLSFFVLGRKKESEHFFSDLVTVRKKKQVKKEKSFKREDSAKTQQQQQQETLVKKEEVDPNQPTVNGGYNLLKRIREIYSKDERPYKALLTMLIKFRNQEMTTDEVVKNIGALFFDHPELFTDPDSLEFFISKDTEKPKKCQWFDWAPNKHFAYQSPAFKLIVQTFLLCEMRHRRKPPDLRNIRLDGHQMDSSDEEYDSDEEESSDTEEEEKKEKESGTLRDDQIPERWDEEKNGPRVLSRFEKLTLEQKPQDEEFCWLDTVAVREKKAKEAEMRKENKRGREAERLSREAGLPDDSDRELSPPPPEGKARKSKRIVEKIQKGIIYDKYKHLHSPIISPGRRRNNGRMSLLGGGGIYGCSVPNDIVPKKNVQLHLKRDLETQTKEQKERPGLHSLPLKCVELVLKHYAKIEGTEELTAIRNKLIKNLEKNK